MPAPPPPGQLAWAIAIPACDDADRIAACMAALARQRGVTMAEGAIVVFASNCHDDTPRIARESRQPCALHVVQQNSVSGRGSMSEARRLAMSHARLKVRDDGILLATDADVIVDDNWVAAMLGCFSDDRIAVVAGAVSAGRDETSPDRNPERSIAALERHYCELIVAAEDAIDPQPHDRAPRHGRESGSNIAIRARMFDAIGGVPDVPGGEVRAMIEAVRARDGGIRHALAPHATTSTPHHARIGESMAALHDQIKSRVWWPAAIVERRLTLRKAARAAYARGEFASWAADHGVHDCAAQACFGSSWAGFVASSPGLAPTPVDRAALPAQIAMLEFLLAQDRDENPG